MTRLWIAALALFVLAGQARAASREVQYGPAPDWVIAAPAATDATPQRGAPVHLVYHDSQMRLSDQGQEAHGAYRLKILTTQGLEAGAIQVSWRGDTDTFTVHSLKVYRGGEVIDVLKTTRFEVIQRERNLERSMLDGVMTAALQAPGLQIGDEIEFSATVLQTDPLMKGRAAGGLQLPPIASPGAYRVRLVWPQTQKLRWKATPDLGAVEPSRGAAGQDLTVELRNPRSVILTDDAPDRVNLRRLIEFSSFSDWAEVASLMQPLYENAAALGPDSAVRREA